MMAQFWQPGSKLSRKAACEWPPSSEQLWLRTVDLARQLQIASTKSNAVEFQQTVSVASP
jgi:hypothetical protein